ncbi:hypothetical protein P7C71_g329, partial [Lecanoromycetidae sp. Uapishka_2]
MGLLSKFSRNPPPTATDLVADEKASPTPASDKEAAHGEELDSFSEINQHHVVPDIERRVVRKMDMRIVSLVTALYILAFLDRSNIGNAKIAGMSKDLKLVGNDYQWLLTIFYITYIIFEFQTLMWKIVPPHMWLAFCVCGWGLIATSQADTPDKARFLTPEEKVVAKARGVRQVGSVERIGGVDFKEIGAALLDLKCWFTAFMYFSCNVGFSSLPVFLPTILNDMGFNAIDSQGLTAPPFFLSFLMTIFSTWVADRTQQRGLTIMVLTFIGGIGYVLLATVKVVGVRYFGVFLAASGIFPTWENRKLDKKYGSNENRVVNQPGAAGEESEVGEENYGPTFRYIL